MTTPCIITGAITSSVPRKEHNPAVPISIAEQIESTQAAFEAGAALAHVHVRNDDQTPTSDPARFALLLEGLRKYCPVRPLILWWMKLRGLHLRRDAWQIYARSMIVIPQLPPRREKFLAWL
jgi:hypothetical protein